MKIYRIAVLGCRAYHEHPRTEVEGLCDLVLELLAILGKELGVAGRQVMEILMGIFESGTYGRRVEVPQKDFNHPLCVGVSRRVWRCPPRYRGPTGSGSKPKTVASAEFH